MHSFVDNAGRTWGIVINVTAIKRVRGLVGVDLYKLSDDGFQPLGMLVADPVKLADVLYCLCKEEAEATGVSDEEFGRALAGDAILHAVDAFVEELIAFFPDARTRTGLSKVIATGRKVQDRLSERAEAMIASVDPDAVARSLSDSFMNLRASSGSTPDLSRSTNS